MNKFDSDAYLFDNAEFLIQPYEKALVDEQLLDQQKQILIHELNKLPKRQKEVLYLVYMKGLTYQQAAEVMDITIKSVYNTINVALTTLRTYVRDSFRQRGALWSLAGAMLDYFTKI